VALEPRKIADGVYGFRYGHVEVTMLLTRALLEAMEDSAWEQLEASLDLPGLERVIVTPDVHTGYAVPIGFTAVSSSHLYPDTVGPDPACSVSLSRVPNPGLERLDKRARRAILDDLERAVVVNVRHRRGSLAPPIAFEELMEILHGRRRRAKTWVAAHPRLTELASSDRLAAFEELMRELDSARLRQQLRTIGGGNHFLEVQVGDDDELYVMAHFGSRGLGATGARWFEERIRADMRARAGRFGGATELLHVPADDPLGQLYELFQQAMLEYATYNHVQVQEAACEVLSRHLGVGPGTFLGHIPHNFIERRDGRWWQRKGATPAYDNDDIPLLIPGSMSTTSYVLAPGPNAERLGASVPHGAGRVLSRGAAKRSLDQEATDAAFEARGVMANFRHVPLDESAAAYKDVAEVIRAVVTSGVAEVVRTLRPVLVLKGA
jgi:tRNA-splicing ligase RtcB